MYLSWVIPVYNEEKRIEKTLREVDRYLRSKNFTGGYEIIVANSASKDRTIEIVKNLEPRIAGLRLLNLENKGKGWAVKRGMLDAKGDVRLFSDADNSVSPEQTDNFLPLLCGDLGTSDCFDVVIGSIEVGGATIEEQAQWYRRFLGRLAKYVIRVVSGLWDIHDSQRGFKFFTKRSAEEIFPRQTLVGWGFDFEVLLIARRRGFKIKEVPVKWVNPPDSKVGLDAYITTLMELLKIKLNDLGGLYRK
jgi:dolichyl-phosphate beta-glucosyltransferase